MRYGRRVGKKSQRDILRGNDAALQFYCGGKAPPELLNNLPPKRNYTKPARMGASEHQLQVAVIQWWALAHRTIYSLPLEVLFAIPNGGARDPITGARLKAEGVRPGVPDLMLAVPCGGEHGAFIEMKTGSNKPTENQVRVCDQLLRAGYHVRTAWSSEEAIGYIQAYLEPLQHIKADNTA